MKITDILDFNPRTNLPKNKDLPFIEMANLPIAGRDIPNIQMRPATGSGSKFANGDTILARITPCLENGKGGMIRNLPKEGIGHGSTEFIVMRAKRPSDQNFVYYLSRLPEFREFAIKQMTGTSGRQRVSWQALEAFDIPEIKEKQREKIGMFLSSIDDKIELNQQMNETLESMAQAIFQDWFIDFGPTRRKMQGTTDPDVILGGLFSTPEKSREIADLFPTTLTDNGLPKGWKERLVKDDFNVVMGQSPPGSTYNESGDGLPFFQGRRDFQFRFPRKRVFCNAPSRLAEKDWTLISVRAPVGDINRAWEKCCIGRGVVALMQRKNMASLTYYTILHLKGELTSYDSHGTVFGSINQNQLKNMKLNASNYEVAKAFEEMINPFDELIRNQTAEIWTLTEIRNILISKLLSGDIHIHDTRILT